MYFPSMGSFVVLLGVSGSLGVPFGGLWGRFGDVLVASRVSFGGLWHTLGPFKSIVNIDVFSHVHPLGSPWVTPLITCVFLVPRGASLLSHRGAFECPLAPFGAPHGCLGSPL